MNLQGSGPRIVWLYEKSHLKQPFIRLGIETLAEAGCRVTLINMLNATLRDCAYHHVGLLDRSRFTWLNSRMLKQYGAYRAGVILPIVMFKHALRFKPDIVIATLPIGLTVGALLKRRIDCRLVYYPLELYGEQLSPFSHFLKWRERRVLRRKVDALITQNKQRAEVYLKERGARVAPTIVCNFKRSRNVTPNNKLRSLLNLSADRLIVLYEGMLTKGRWLDCLVQAARFLPEQAHMVLLGKIDNKDRWWDHTIAELLKDPAIGSKVSIMPWVEPNKLMDYVSGADVGLIIYDNAFRNNYFCAPGKLSDYVLAKVPVVVPNFPSIGPLIEHYGIGASFDTPEPRDIARAITRVLDFSKTECHDALDRASKELIWESQAPQFLTAVLGEKFGR